MRKGIFFLLVFMTLLTVAQAGCAAENEKELTIMVYICGSNLESRYGSATADIQEMLASGLNGSKVSLLVMAGGTRQWMGGHQAEELSVIEIKNGKQRIVKRLPTQSMGEASTLTSFIRFGMENYTANGYALILWDHGGGPLEGVCWDELFSLDHLSLHELMEALASANLEKKLKWIGFDACLMCSMEVAFALSPYAEYMIASQETEPSFGWNYAFLESIDQDSNGAETGRKIVDAYFEGQEDQRDILTLSCLNLQKAEELREEMDRFFIPVSEVVNTRNYVQLSDARHQATGFGSGLRSAGEEGYDLVDAAGLIEQLDDDTGRKEYLMQSLAQMVVYSRSNEQGANGISLYHPYSNAAKYTDQWHEDYLSLNFCRGYTDYIERFGAILTGEKLTSWAGLKTEFLGENQSGGYLLELPLSREQAEGMVSAQLLVFVSGFNQMEEIDDTALIFSGPAELTDEGMLCAVYDKTTLWAVDEQGQYTGPISFDLTDDGKYQVTNVLYTPNGYYSWETDQDWVRYYLNPEGGKIPTIDRTMVYDEATQSFTNRLGFEEKYYDEAAFRVFFRMMPEINPEEPLPAYHEWPVNRDSFSYRKIPLPQEWHFEYRNEFLSGEQYFAVFQITDMQQKTYCSAPVLIPNPNLIQAQMDSETLETEKMRFSCDILRDTSQIESGVMIYATVENLTDTETSYSINEILINGTRKIGTYCSFWKVGPGEKASERLIISEESLLLLPEINSITLFISESLYGSDGQAIPFRFDLQSSLPGSLMESKSEGLTEHQGLQWEILNLSENSNGDLDAFLHLSNLSSEKAALENWEIGIGPLQLAAAFSYGTVKILNPGEDAVARCTIQNRALLESIDMFQLDTLRVQGNEHVFPEYILKEKLLQSHGIIQIDQLSFFHASDAVFWLSDMKVPEEGRFSLPLNESFVLSSIDPAKQEHEEKRLLIAQEDFEITWGKLFLGENGYAMSMQVKNKTDKPILIEIMGQTVNDLPSKGDRPFAIGSYMTREICVASTPEGLTGGTQAKSISFTVKYNLEAGIPVRIQMNSPVYFGEPDGLFVAPDLLDF